MHRREDLFQRCVAYMQQNIEKNLKSRDLVAALGVSKPTLSRCFTKYADCGIHEYFMQLRLEESKQLLRRGFTAKQVTNAMNFSSASYFSAWFKENTGHTPTGFRQLAE